MDTTSTPQTTLAQDLDQMLQDIRDGKITGELNPAATLTQWWNELPMTLRQRSARDRDEQSLDPDEFARDAENYYDFLED